MLETINQRDPNSGLFSDDESERIYAVYDLAVSGNPDAPLALARRLFHEDSPAVRDTILFFLKKFDCSQVFNLLFAMLTSQDAYLRNAAVSIFGSNGAKGLHFLTPRLAHSETEVRKLILDALVEIGTEEAILAIRAALDDSSLNVRITAVEYLGILADKTSIEEMLRLFQSHSEPMLRISIINAISMMRDTDAIKKLISTIMPERDVKSIDPVYLPQLIRLVSKACDVEDVFMIVSSIKDVSLYGEDIISALIEAERRFEGVLTNEKMLNILAQIISQPSLKEKINNGALQILSRLELTDVKKLIEERIEKTEDDDFRSLLEDLLEEMNW